jgi:hypothetical protein
VAIGSAYLLEHHDVRTSPGNKLEVRLCSPILLSHPPKVALSVLAHPGILIKAVENRFAGSDLRSHAYYFRRM